MFSLLSYSSASVCFPDSAVCAVCHAGIRALLFFRADAKIYLTRLKACVSCRVKRMLFAGFPACGGPHKRHSSSSPQCDSALRAKKYPHPGGRQRCLPGQGHANGSGNGSVGFVFNSDKFF